MPRKFQIGLGDVNLLATSTQGGTGVSIFSGSRVDEVINSVLGTLVVAGPAQIDPTKVVVSQDSAVSYHSTLFEDFNLRAAGVYNFYTADEQTAPVPNSSASLGSIPRYVQLAWDPTPVKRVLLLSRKGMRPLDPRATSINPAMGVSDAKKSVANGFVSPGVVSALLVAPIVVQPKPEFHEDLFLSSPQAAGLMAADHIDSGSVYHAPVLPTSTTRLRVNFIDPSIAGALDPNRISVASDQTHLASLGALAKLAGALEVISEFNQDVPTRNPPPKFPANPDTPALMYIGYVIERYTLDPSGAMTLTKTIDIDDPNQTKYVDRDVVYGGRYTYRIKSVAQWTHDQNVEFTGESTLDKLPKFDTSAGSLSKRASFYSGNWSTWSPAEIKDTSPPDPPDELRVQPVSPKGHVRVTWKMPGDPQRDISALRLVRAVSRNGRLTDWQLLGEFVPGNGLFVDTDVRDFEAGQESYVYAMYSLSFHGELSVLSEKIEARLTGRSRYLGEHPVRQLGPRGDDPMDHATGARIPSETELVAQKSATVYIRGAKSTLALFDRTYTVEVQSLSTGERAEVQLSVDTTDVDVAPSGAASRA